MVNSSSEKSLDRFVPLARQFTASQIEAIKAIPAHHEAHAPTDEAERPASIYTDLSRFEAEMAHIFKRVPLVILPSAALAENGSFIAIDAFGLPLLLSRDKNGEAHVFLNICRHRGAKVVEVCNEVRKGRVTCPYHAWSYGSDGTLLAIPRAETFPSADKSDLGLLALKSFETAGFIWMGMEPNAPVSLLEGTEQLDEDLQAIGLPGMHVYGQSYYDLKSNWKLVMEPFLEAYHVKRLHARTVADLNADNHPVPVWLGKHLRQTAGRVDFDPADIDFSSDALHKSITHAYNIFPNTIIVTSPYFISTMVLMPLAVDRTIVQYSMLMPQPIMGERAEELFRKSFEFQDAIFREDFSAGELQQAGLSCGFLDKVRFGGMEKSIGPFHDLVESFLPAETV